MLFQGRAGTREAEMTYHFYFCRHFQGNFGLTTPLPLLEDLWLALFVICDHANRCMRALSRCMAASKNQCTPACTRRRTRIAVVDHPGGCSICNPVQLIGKPKRCAQLLACLDSLYTLYSHKVICGVCRQKHVHEAGPCQKLPELD